MNWVNAPVSEVKSRSRAEMGLQSVKCFKCAKLGHVAKDCPEKRQNQSTRRIVLSEDASGSQDPWLLMLTTETMQQYQPDTDDPCLCAVTMPIDRLLYTKQKLVWTVLGLELYLITVHKCL